MQFPMALLRATEFIKLGKLVQHETLRDNKLLTMLDTPGAAAKFCRKGCIIFFPHQWLSSESPDPSRQHFEDMTKAIQEQHALSLSLSLRKSFMPTRKYPATSRVTPPDFGADWRCSVH